MKKILPVFLIGFVFSLAYLHQKINIYVEAYKLSKNYEQHNELVDERDCLMYNFVKECSLDKINQWARDQDFALVDKKRVFALNTRTRSQTTDNKVALLLKRFLNISESAVAAMVKEKK